MGQLSTLSPPFFSSQYSSFSSLFFSLILPLETKKPAAPSPSLSLSPPAALPFLSSPSQQLPSLPPSHKTSRHRYSLSFSLTATATTTSLSLSQPSATTSLLLLPRKPPPPISLSPEQLQPPPSSSPHRPTTESLPPSLPQPRSATVPLSSSSQNNRHHPPLYSPKNPQSVSLSLLTAISLSFSPKTSSSALFSSPSGST